LDLVGGGTNLLAGLAVVEIGIHLFRHGFLKDACTTSSKIRTPSVISDSQNSIADKNSPPKDTFSSEALV
jgi:hypothetical protein